jgi:hypothetical protein
VKWDFSRRYLATLEVDLAGQDPRANRLRWPPIKGRLFLRAYDFEGNAVLDEFLDEISAGIDIGIADDGMIGALYRKYDAARWTPSRTYTSSDFVLVIANLHDGSIERRRFSVERDTYHGDLAMSANGRYVAFEVFALGRIDLCEIDAILKDSEGPNRSLRTSLLPGVLPGKPEVELRHSSAVFEVSSRGFVAKSVLCQEGDKRYERILVSDGQGTWSAVSTPNLELGDRILCRFLGSEDYLLVGSGSFLKCFRILQQ